MTKRDIAIKIMEANKGQDFDHVVELIISHTGLATPAARSMYRWLIANGKVEGYTLTDAKPARKGKAKPAPKVKNVVTKVEKSAAEVAAIKEKNLETMRKVTAKLEGGKKKKVVRDYGDRVAKPEGEGVSDFDPQLAREEIDSILRDEKLIGQVPKFAQGDY